MLCERNKDIKKWVEFINIWSPRALEYRVSNVDVFNYLLNILDVKEIAKDYTSDGYLSWKTIAEELRESYLQMASRKLTLCFTLNYCV